MFYVGFFLQRKGGRVKKGGKEQIFKKVFRAFKKHIERSHQSQFKYFYSCRNTVGCITIMLFD
jgi:hypothetical protein